MFGKLLALPLRILNVPLKVVDKVILDEEEDVMAFPLEIAAEVVEEAIDGKEPL